MTNILIGSAWLMALFLFVDCFIWAYGPFSEWRPNGGVEWTIFTITFITYATFAPLLLYIILRETNFCRNKPKTIVRL